MSLLLSDDKKNRQDRLEKVEKALEKLKERFSEKHLWNETDYAEGYFDGLEFAVDIITEALKEGA